MPPFPYRARDWALDWRTAGLPTTSSELLAKKYCALPAAKLTVVALAKKYRTLPEFRENASELALTNCDEPPSSRVLVLA